MNSWNKRARAGVAVFGLAVAAIVYAAMGERKIAHAPEPVQRMDPKAILETYSSVLERITGTEKNFAVDFDRSQSYEDGSMRMFGVSIVVRKGENRTFTVTAKEAYAGKDQIELQLTGDVVLRDSDGFSLKADAATFHQQEAVARAPGMITFGKGRMSGSGVGMAYNQSTDVLTIDEQAEVTTLDEAGETVMHLVSGSATLDRMQHQLAMGGSVHVLRSEQTIEADNIKARLSDNNEVITFVELRGNSRVEGGSSNVDAMSARDIDLDYTDDGLRLEAVAMSGGAAAAMRSSNSASQEILAETVHLALGADGSSRMVLNGNGRITMAGEGGRTGRRVAGESLELEIAADGSLTRAVGREGVRLDLPAAPNTPVRSIQARTLDGSGEPGRGLTRATFEGDVVFTETARSKAAGRTARAQKLEAGLVNDVVAAATFTGDASFEETGLKACAARMEYAPEQGTLALSGATPAGNPVVAEEQINIEAQTIDISLDTRRMVAKANVRTQMRAGTRCRPAASRPAGEQGASRMPGLLDPEAAATITAAALDYQGGSGKAVYTGRVVLAQRETAIHADSITIDQSNGDLTATGNAISTMTLDGDTMTGRAHEIRYVDRTRTITYTAPPASSVTPPPGSVAPPPGSVAPLPGSIAPPPGSVAPPAATAGAATAVAEPQISGPLGFLQAARIDVALAEQAGTARQITARGNVRMRQGIRNVTGGATLTYDPAEEKYVMTGEGTVPVKVVERQNASCREFSGRSLIFYKSTDNIVIDGDNLNRTQTTPGACPPAAR